MNEKLNIETDPQNQDLQSKSDFEPVVIWILRTYMKKKLKALNLYSGIGGNRKLWQNVSVTAVEWNADIANIYKRLYPKDKVIVGDAHEYLEKNYKEFDFIWSSPPCQTHSSFRYNIGVRYRGVAATYADMKLYQEILFLKHYADCMWVVENVKPFYTPLIMPDGELQRHLFWSNFRIYEKEFKKSLIRRMQIPQLQKMHGIDLTNDKLKNKRQVLRNCVLPQLGLHILNCAIGKQNSI